MDPWLKENLVCPRDKTELEFFRGKLICARGHQYHCVDDIPIMLPHDAKSTHFMYDMTLKTGEYGISYKEDDEAILAKDEIDPYVQVNVAHTCGNMYHGLIDNLTDYPIPELPLPEGNGDYLLDIGCNWGRWCISAARKGYNAIGTDHSVFPIRAGRRLAKRMGLNARFIVADARFLPFKSDAFDVVHSFGVIQHLKKVEARKALAEIPKVLKPDGTCLIQMPNVIGPRNLYSQLKILLTGEEIAGVNYWSLSELERTFNAIIGPTSLSVDSFFTLNAQTADLHLLPRRYRFVVLLSKALKKLSKKIPPLIHIADSIYMESQPVKPNALP